MTDVKITPASRKIEFFGSDDALDAAISTDTSGNLSITNVGGEISLGDTTADIHIGDGTNSVDLVFDQAGSIYSVSGQTLTLGSTTGGSTAVDSSLFINGSVYHDVAGQNFVLRSDTTTQETLEFQQGTTRRWVLNFESDGDLNFQASDSADLFRVQGNRVLTTADEGSGNGLDADTLDGYHSSSFLRESMGTVATDFNNYTSTGIFIVSNWSGSSIANGPTGSYAWGMLEVKQFSGTSGTYVNQQYWPHNADGVWTRTKWNGTWTGWREIFSSSSDGSGSGLDADLLDGQHGSYYAAASSLSSYLPLSGGTMGGAINMNNLNINGVNQLTINDPGEGIVFTGTNNVTLYAIDDANDNIMNFSNAAELRRNNNKVWDAGNDGSGSGLDADTVDGVQASSFLRSDQSDTLTSGTLSVDGKIKINSGGSLYYETSTAGGYIPRPNGGHFITTSGGASGAIQIKLPVNGVFDMISFHVDIYDYTTDESVSLFISGYQNASVGGDTWVNCEARVLTTSSSKNYTVRFGDDGSQAAVWIGETNSTWSYPQILVRDVQVGYSADVDTWDDGWDISLVTSFGTVNETQTNNWPMAYYATSAGSATSATNATQLGGYASTEYLRKDTAGQLFSLTVNASGTDIIKDLAGDLVLRNSNTGTDDGVVLSTYGSSAQRTAFKAFGGTDSYVQGYYNGNYKFGTTSSGIDVGGYVDASSGIRHKNDTDTYIAFNNDRITMYAGNIEMLDLYDGTVEYWVDIIDRVRVEYNGDMICEGNITAYTTTSVSDERRKDNIQVIDNALDKVSQLKGVTFNWKHNGTASAGLIAQDVEKVLPEIVVDKKIRDQGTYKVVDYDGVIGLLVESIKELKAEIEVLKNASPK